MQQLHTLRLEIIMSNLRLPYREAIVKIIEDVNAARMRTVFFIEHDPHFSENEKQHRRTTETSADHDTYTMFYDDYRIVADCRIFRSS